MHAAYIRVTLVCLLCRRVAPCKFVSHEAVHAVALPRTSSTPSNRTPLDIVVGIRQWMESASIRVDIIGGHGLRADEGCAVDRIIDAPVVQGQLDRPRAYSQEKTATGFTMALGPSPTMLGCQPDRQTHVLAHPSECTVSFTVLLTSECATRQGSPIVLGVTCPRYGGTPSPPPPLPPSPPPPPTPCDLGIVYTKIVPGPAPAGARTSLRARVAVLDWVAGTVLQFQWYGCGPVAFSEWDYAHAQRLPDGTVHADEPSARSSMPHLETASAHQHAYGMYEYGDADGRRSLQRRSLRPADLLSLSEHPLPVRTISPSAVTVPGGSTLAASPPSAPEPSATMVGLPTVSPTVRSPTGEAVGNDVGSAWVAAESPILVADSPQHLMSVKLLDPPQAAVVIKDSVGAEITARAFYFTAVQSGSEGSCDKLEAPLITCFARVRASMTYSTIGPLAAH